MDRGATYDDDIYAWSQKQAAALRSLAESRHDLPNELDLENVAEEIEDVGKSEVRTVESFIELMFRHLLKLASAPNSVVCRHWRNELELQQRAVRKDLRRSMYQLIEVDQLWDAALRRADADLDALGDVLVAGVPQASPFDLDELRAGLDVEAALARIRAQSPAA